MKLKGFLAIASGSLLLMILLQPVWGGFSVLFASAVVAQTPDARKAEADRLLQQGIEQYKTSQFEAALQSWQQALIIYREIKDRKGEGQSLGNLGNAYYSLGNYAKAIEYQQQSLEIAREIKDREGEGTALGNLGVAYNSLGNYAKGIDYHQQRLAIAREIKDRNGEGQSLGNLGNAYYFLGNYTKAINYQQQSLEIAREIKDRKGESQSLGNLGLAYFELGNYDKAINYHQQTLAIAREIKDRLGEGQSLGNLGIAYRALGNYVKAIDYQEQSLAIAREIKDRQGEGTALGNLGVAYNSLGNYAKTIEYYQQSLVVAREIKDRFGEGKVLGNLGVSYRLLGDYTKAIEYHEQSLAVAREVKDRKGEGHSLGNLGIAYNSLGNYAKAIEYHQQSLAIAREIKDRLGEGKVLGNLGVSYRLLGDYAKAIEYHEQSLAVAREIKDRHGEGQSLGNLGNAYRSLGNYAKAIEYYQQSLAVAREIKDRLGEGGVLGNLGNAYNLLGDYAKAIEYNEQNLAIAREIKDRPGEGQSLSNLGGAYYALGNYAKAIEYCQQSLAVAREIKDRKLEGESLNNLGFNLYESGKFAEAEKILRTGTEVWESVRGRLGNNDSYKVSIFEEQSRTYRTLQQVLIAQNKTSEALEISERGRGRAFVELLTSRLSSKTTSQTLEPTVAKPTLSLLQQIAKQQNATFVQYSWMGDNFKIQGKQEWKESELYIWVIKPTGEVTFRKADLKPLWQKQNSSLANLISNTRESIGIDTDESIVANRNISRSFNEYNRNIFDQKIIAPNDSDQAKNLQQLHELLISPIADLLPTDPNQSVIFVPQGDLFLVPFPALQDKQGKYLIEKHTILTSPSIQVLELTHQQRDKVKQSGARNAIVVGNPTMPSLQPKIGAKPQQLPKLPGAETEALTIAPILNTKPLTGDKATKAAILAQLPEAKIIHLATHGIFDDFQGLQSSVALAPSGKDDGFLTAEEILGLKLNADLVVLSACNTGRGRITGDGVIGLSRALISAGAPSVIVSLWSVPDAPTADLMSEFYTNMFQNKLDKAQALRQAMLKVKNKYPNAPKKWAAFTLIGEAE